LHEVQIFVPVALTINGNTKLSPFIFSGHLLTRYACGELKNQYIGFEDVKTDTRHYTSHTGFYLVHVSRIHHNVFHFTGD